jgi:hypothetical protein
MCMKKLQVACAAMLMIGLADTQHDYDYYIRVIVFFSSMYIVIQEMDTDVKFWLIPVVLVSILFNPFVPIDFGNSMVLGYVYIIGMTVFLLKTVNYQDVKSKNLSEAY